VTRLYATRVRKFSLLQNIKSGDGTRLAP